MPTVSSNNKFVEKEHYSLSYNEGAEQAEWVAYKLSKSDLADHFERKDDFRSDPEIKLFKRL